jgi:hypothetical protein
VVEYNNKISTATSPGKIGSVDQKQPTVPGMVGQLKGIPARQRMSFVHLQMTPSGEETLDAKMAFQGFVRSPNVQVQHHHADNGRFC